MEALDLMFPNWQVQYFEALSEGLPETLRERVDDADRAILARLEQLVGSSEREMEQFALRDALDTLCVIKTEKLDFSQAAALVDHMERRRSPRVLFNVELMVCGASPEKQLFQEEASTLFISTQGALMALTTRVTLGQKLLLIDPKTWNKREGRVIHLGALDGERTQVGIEFAQPAPKFWRIGAPPERSFPF